MTATSEQAMPSNLKVDLSSKPCPSLPDTSEVVAPKSDAAFQQFQDNLHFQMKSTAKQQMDLAKAAQAYRKSLEQTSAAAEEFSKAMARVAELALFENNSDSSLLVKESDVQISPHNARVASYFHHVAKFHKLVSKQFFGLGDSLYHLEVPLVDNSKEYIQSFQQWEHRFKVASTPLTKEIRRYESTAKHLNKESSVNDLANVLNCLADNISDLEHLRQNHVNEAMELERKQFDFIAHHTQILLKREIKSHRQIYYQVVQNIPDLIDTRKIQSVLGTSQAAIPFVKSKSNNSSSDAALSPRSPFTKDTRGQFHEINTSPKDTSPGPISDNQLDHDKSFVYPPPARRPSAHLVPSRRLSAHFVPSIQPSTTSSTEKKSPGLFRSRSKNSSKSSKSSKSYSEDVVENQPDLAMEKRDAAHDEMVAAQQIPGTIPLDEDDIRESRQVTKSMFLGTAAHIDTRDEVTDLRESKQITKSMFLDTAEHIDTRNEDTDTDTRESKHVTKSMFLGTAELVDTRDEVTGPMTDAELPAPIIASNHTDATASNHSVQSTVEVLFRGKVLSDYVQRSNSDLTVSKNDILEILLVDGEWCFGNIVGDTAKEGWVPYSFIEVLK